MVVNWAVSSRQQMVLNWAVSSRFLCSSCLKIADKVDEMGSSQLLFPCRLCGSLILEGVVFPLPIPNSWELFVGVFLSYGKRG